MSNARLIATARRSAALAAMKRRRALRHRRPPRIIYPRGIERAYQRLLVGLVDEIAAEVERIVIPRLPEWQAEIAMTRPDSARLDNWAADIGNLLRLVLAGMQAVRSTVVEQARTVGEEAAAWATRQEAKVFIAFDMESFFRQPWLADAIDAFHVENTSLITRLSDDTVTKVGETIMREFRKGTDHRKVARDIRDRFGIEKNRAKTIARDQVSSLNGEIHRLTQTEMGVTSYVWRSALDDRVRPSHEEKEGQTYRWDDPPADTGHPGQDINCRCTSEPVLDDLIEETNRILESVRVA